jgi:hypothetical protein
MCRDGLVRRLTISAIFDGGFHVRLLGFSYRKT